MPPNSEAIRLAEASDWKGLTRLIEKAPELACERGDYGMLPIHWACTEAHVPLALLDKLLAAYPDGARTKNDAHYLPLHIAIRARVNASWLRKLLAVNPLAVHVDTPEQLSVLELAHQVRLGKDAMRVLLEAHDEVSPEQDERDGAECGAVTQENDADDDDHDRSPVKKPHHQMQHYQLLNAMTTTKKSSSSLSPVRAAAGSERYHLVPNQDDEQSDDQHDHDNDNETDDDDLQHHRWLPLIHGISRLTSTDTSDAVGSPLLRSMSSLSDDGTLDSPHDDNLVSPSSTSTSSQANSTSSVNSAPLPLTVPPLHKQMQGPFHRKHSLDYHRTAAAAAREHQESLSAKRSRNQPQSRSAVTGGQIGGGGGRHHSMPVVPSFENVKFAPVAINPKQYSGRRPHDMYHDRSSEEDESEHACRRYHRFNSGGGGGSGGSGGFRNHSGRGVEYDDDEMEIEMGSGRHFESPPEWKRDDECSICHVSFGMFKHRHHCRNCGKSICSQHSADRKVSMTSKGFKTPQRVCVTCYDVLTNQSQPKHELSPFDAVLDAAGLSGSNNPVVSFAMQHNMALQQQQQQQQQQQHYALGTQSLRSPRYSSPLSNKNKNNGGSPNGTFLSGGTGSTASLHHTHLGVSTTGNTGIGNNSITKEKMETYLLQAQVSELRRLVSAQQRQIEQLVQNNIQMQQQVLEHEELKAETMLLITQLMTRVSVLELQKNDDRRDGDEDEDGDQDEEAQTGGF